MLPSTGEAQELRNAAPLAGANPAALPRWCWRWRSCAPARTSCGQALGRRFTKYRHIPQLLLAACTCTCAWTSLPGLGTSTALMQGCGEHQQDHGVQQHGPAPSRRPANHCWSVAVAAAPSHHALHRRQNVRGKPCLRIHALHGGPARVQVILNSRGAAVLHQSVGHKGAGSGSCAGSVHSQPG